MYFVYHTMMKVPMAYVGVNDLGLLPYANIWLIGSFNVTKF